jgi:hypothetical protein
MRKSVGNRKIIMSDFVRQYDFLNFHLGKQKIVWRGYIWTARGMIECCNIFWGQKLANTYSLWRAHFRATRKNLESRNPLSESEVLQSWGCSKIFLSFLMRFDGHFWLNQQKEQQCLPQFESSLDGHLSCHLLQFPSVSKLRKLPNNVWSVQGLISISLLHQY